MNSLICSVLIKKIVYKIYSKSPWIPLALVLYFFGVQISFLFKIKEKFTHKLLNLLLKTNYTTPTILPLYNIYLAAYSFKVKYRIEKFTTCS